MKLKKALYSWVEKKYLPGCSDYNSLQVRRSCRSKKQARQMFEKLGVPYAKGLVFVNPWKAYKFVEQHGFPVVLKPNVGGFSRGSHFPIMSYKEFWKAMFFVKWWWPSSVVEQYLLGKNYRVVTTKGSVDIAMQRYPAFVVGDGALSISDLIDKENETRKTMKLAPVIYPIQKSAKIKAHLKKHGHDFQTIPEKDQHIELYHRVSLAPGGVLETVNTDNITEKNKELFLKILDGFGANIFGIDVIMEKGIDVDYDQQKCIFLEVNSRPYLEMHRKPRFGSPVDLGPLHEKLSKIEIAGKGTY
ncbi:MAG: cyanophycin synthetase [Candidatus Gracilibacteria bacterium]|nr:cyanophycin synthetase [Candidatus Gracilibacteria bacterium]